MILNCRFFLQKFSEIFLNYPRNVKIKIRKLTAHDLSIENVIILVCVALSYHTNKHIDNFIKQKQVCILICFIAA